MTKQKLFLALNLCGPWVFTLWDPRSGFAAGFPSDALCLAAQTHVAMLSMLTAHKGFSPMILGTTIDEKIWIIGSWRILARRRIIIPIDEGRIMVEIVGNISKIKLEQRLQSILFRFNGKARKPSAPSFARELPLDHLYADRQRNVGPGTPS